MKVVWDKRYSGPHCAWVLTRNGVDVEYTRTLPEVVRRAALGVFIFPRPYVCPVLFETEFSIDQVIDRLRAAEETEDR